MKEHRVYLWDNLTKSRSYLDESFNDDEKAEAASKDLMKKALAAKQANHPAFNVGNTVIDMTKVKFFRVGVEHEESQSLMLGAVFLLPFGLLALLLFLAF